ncbi:MAG: DUF4230 domain-containing protein [Gemmataceae bacterium]
MLRRTLLVVALLSAPPAAPARAAEPPGLSLESVLKVAKNVPVTLLIDVLDEVTRRETVESKAKLRGLLPHLKLRVHSASVDVTVEGEEVIWRGTTTVKLSMPADVEYTLDLDELRAGNLKWDKGRKLLKVKLPDVKVGAVVPRLEDEKVETRSGWARPSWFRGGRAGGLEARLRSEHFRPAAVREAEKRMDDARRSARDQVRDLLRRLWLPHASDIEIVVE